MTLSSEIFDYLDTLSPAALALDWDNSGLQVGSRNAPVRKILVALDPSSRRMPGRPRHGGPSW